MVEGVSLLLFFVLCNVFRVVKLTLDQDGLFSRSRFSQFHRVLAPKVTGTINLHEATKNLPLDFILMTSSLVGTVGTATQAAYAAANAF